jgi:predicted Fe-Mo cluster-binding NifX family protein
MKIAMPTSATRVSPRFDCAKSVLVVTIDNGGHQTAANLKPPIEMCVRGRSGGGSGSRTLDAETCVATEVSKTTFQPECEK